LSFNDRCASAERDSCALGGHCSRFIGERVDSVHDSAAEQQTSAHARLRIFTPGVACVTAVGSHYADSGC